MALSLPTLLHITWHLSLVVVSLALQNQRTGTEQTLIPTHEALTAPAKIVKNDWSTLRDWYRQEASLTWQTCSSDEYETHYNSLPGAFDMSTLEIPANSRILFYGTSMLRQVLDNILVANMDKLIPENGHGLDRPPVEGNKLGDIKVWQFTTNTTITKVVNYDLLQRPHNIQNLKEYLDKNAFDIAFYMNPHPSCWWNTSCSTINPFPDLGDDRSDMNPLYETVKEAIPNTFEVEAWSKEPRKTFHADNEHIIRTSEVLISHACNSDDNCKEQSLFGHQCQPGRLAWISEMVAATVRRQMSLPDTPGAQYHVTCRDACDADGCECKECGAGQAYTCNGCCCQCPSKPTCPVTLTEVSYFECDSLGIS